MHPSPICLDGLGNLLWLVQGAPALLRKAPDRARRRLPAARRGRPRLATSCPHRSAQSVASLATHAPGRIGARALPMRAICCASIMSPRIRWNRASVTPEPMYCQR